MTCPTRAGDLDPGERHDHDPSDLDHERADPGELAERVAHLLVMRHLGEAGAGDVARLDALTTRLDLLAAKGRLRARERRAPGGDP